MERWFTIVFILISCYSANSLAFKVSSNMTKDRTVFETLPVIGKAFQKDIEAIQDQYDTSDSGVFYHNIPEDVFMKIDFTFKPGSLKKSLEEAATKYKWKLIWEPRVDYDIPVSFSVYSKRLPEVFAEGLEHLPIKVVFYARNKVIRVLPMYDKRESEFGSKFAISQSYD